MGKNQAKALWLRGFFLCALAAASMNACTRPAAQSHGATFNHNAIFNNGTEPSGGTFSATDLTTACSTCHESDRPVPVAGVPHGNNADCVNCHSSFTVWNTNTTFNHTPTPSSCSSCHASALPSSTTLLPSGSTQNLFQHAAAFNGTDDCVSCHTNIIQNVGMSWAGGNYDHKNNSGSTVATCQPCHTAERPVGLIGSPPFNHANAGTGDCASCHTNAGLSWTGGSYSHSPTPTTCSGCHNSDLPSTTTLLPAGATSNLYEHAAGYNGLSDCVSCHTNVVGNIGVRWAGGIYNHLNSSGIAVTNCQICHTGDRPSGMVPVSNPVYDHVNGGMGDCASCHSNPGVSWVTSSFNHSPTPASCNSCHSGSRPSPTTLLPANSTHNRYEHATTFNGLADCVSCHTSVSANIGVRWAGGIYNHRTNTNTLLTTSCSTCHVGDRPTGPVGTPAFDHANGGLGACESCHSNTANIGVTWAGGQFNHSPTPSLCATCHESERPGPAVIEPPGATRDQYRHAAANYGLADCTYCHMRVPANLGVRWAGGWYNHQNASGQTGQLTACSTCHEGNRPRNHHVGQDCRGSGCHSSTTNWN